MGLMECPAGHGRLITTPHPVTLEGQTNIAAQLVAGETLGAFLRRSVPNWNGDAWEVRINGVLVPVEVMDRVRPKDRTVIEVRGVVRKQALYIVAMIALTYFKMGAGAAWAGAIGATGMAATAVYAAAFVAGSVLINKVLGPKPASANGMPQQHTVLSIGAARNQKRHYQPLPLVFGRVYYAPDVISNEYTWYEGDDQFVGMVLTPGINAHRVETLMNGDAPLDIFQGVRVYHSGFPGMASETIPLYSNADTIAGGELNKNQTWVQRTTPTRTVRIQVNINYAIGDADSKARPVLNSEIVEVEYRPFGTEAWGVLVTRQLSGSDPTKESRATLARDVPEGQYDVRVRIRGIAVDGGGSNGRAQFAWRDMTAVQADSATYAGIPRIGVRIKATGQLNTAPDELRCVVHARPIPVWKGVGWVTEETSNPGAQILAYARGIHDESGVRIAGIGLTDDMIDIESLQAFMLHCAANGFEYNFVVKDVRNHEEMVNALAATGFGQVTWAGGRLSVVWAADDQPLSGVVNMSTIKKGQFQIDYMLANSADGIEFSYYDATDWSTKTIRIPAPGVTTMLNPAVLTGEGITNEAHAAMQGRFHLAQNLYQRKDISYSTDIEHLSYRRLSLLSLSHDLTQWGFSGQLVGASIVGGVVSVAVSEPVRAPTTGTAYIGLRIPGERTYRVFPVAPFEGEATSLTLVGAWPNDAQFPGVGFYRPGGEFEPNPTHDTLWCYDFKATPGYRVRVVSITPESGLKGASVAVVPEGPEYWEYVRTGRFIPAPNESLLQTRPVASGLSISERQVPQGDTVFTELVATFDISGPVGDVVVQMSNENDELVEVARTTTRTAVWRIPRAGTYQIVVRPFAPDGQPGIAAATVYSTIGADAPPVLVDIFEVQERSGGVRLYTWGWLGGTTQSADFAGVEIRYVPGFEPNPNWAAMTPVGQDGYHTAPFEAVIPESGQWTFAARSRNTSGTLSTGMRVITRTLGVNLGEQLDQIGQDMEGIRGELAEEIIARFNENARIAQEAAEDATNKANAARDAAFAAVNALAAEVAEIAGAPEWTAEFEFQAGFLAKEDGQLYRARIDSTGLRPSENPAAWELLGQYSSVADVAAAALQLAQTNASDIAAEAQRLDVIYARMPVGAGELATADALDLVVTRIENNEGDISALAQRTGVVEATLPDLATSSSVTNLQEALSSAEQQFAADITTVRGTAEGAQGTATQALQVANGQASAITAVQNKVGSTGNLMPDSEFALGLSGIWIAGNSAGYSQPILNMDGADWRPAGVNTVGMRGGASGSGIAYMDFFGYTVPVEIGKSYIVSVHLSAYMCGMQLGYGFRDKFGNVILADYGPVAAGGTGNTDLRTWPRYAAKTPPAPEGAVSVALIVLVTAYGPNSSARMLRPMIEEAGATQTEASPWAPSVLNLSSVTQVLQAGLNTKFGIYLDVSGRISGVESTNNGVIADFNVSADRFRVTSPSGGTRLEWSNGNIRVFDVNGIQRVRLGVG